MTATHETTVYDERPWTAQYGEGVRPDIPEPLFRTLLELLANACSRYPSQKITICLPNGLERTITYQELDQLSDHFAAWLRFDFGLRRGERVAIQMPNCLAFPIALFGVIKAGGIAVNTNPLYTEDEMLYQFRDSGARLLVILDMFAEKVQHVRDGGVQQVVTASLFELFSSLPRSFFEFVLRRKRQLPPKPKGSTTFRETLERGARHRATGAVRTDGTWVLPRLDLSEPEQIVGPGDVALLQYTGGTTGKSKGAVLTHANLLWGIGEFVEMAGRKIERGSGVSLAAIPLYHIFAFQERLMAQLYYGAQIVLAPSPRPIANLKNAFKKHRITTIAGVNTLYNALLQEPWFRENPPKSLKLSIGGGSAVVRETAEAWETLTGCALVEGYGMSETSCLIAFNPLQGETHLGTVGVPACNTRMRIVDELWNPVATGEPGELLVKGPQVTSGYWNDPEVTAATIRDGWLATGDIAIMEPDGYVKLVDRKKDMIIVSGFKVFPNQVEEVLMRHPKVVEAAVIGIPDEKTGEAVKAFVVPREVVDPKELEAFAREHLASYKVPKVYGFRSDLPKTLVGKILRKELRREEMEIVAALKSS